MLRVALSSQADAREWRDAARALVLAGVAPAEVDWSVAGAGDLFGAGDALPRPGAGAVPARVPRRFPDLLEAALCHSDPGRFAMLYRLLWRLQDQPHLLEVAPDPDVQWLHRAVKSVRRDVHKMHAFVRFREIPSDGRRSFVAWFEPDHHIVARAAPFFARRFADMDWLILTPRGRAGFADGQLRTDEVPAEKPALEDPTENLWRTYFGAIFNPARLKVRAMQSEMPRKYWKNLPEAALIPQMIAGAGETVARMEAQADRAPPAFHAAIRARRTVPAEPPAPDGWPGLRAGMLGCTRCTLHAQATGAVPGEGPQDAALMIVGEQPGDLEDLAGRPFVGPAGQVLDRALAGAGIDRSRSYLTNAVKHFKFTPRGKRRIHQRPDAGEVSHCRWWLTQEIGMVRPRLIVAMGATAMLGLTGRSGKMGELRGRIIERGQGPAILPTWHPAYLLRLPDAVQAAVATRQFEDDLALAAAFLSGAGTPAAPR
ncbi:DUF4130 domain-containing protein (plasmid) [Paracoccus yeei]|uniref:Type-4 uracil-DNA glycosylase n=1 Tax=Paracoccus yeei TaxID=147645 RepID=A0A386UUY1_9RHOB|nr:UdgX family uracil-DNA binding protein [Paracoccus yeei]AYF04059.1 DUF4130 domain-containing protein [Paracoccus yeei]